MSPPIVLVVEDEQLVLEATSDLLADAGFQVVPAATCAEALAALDNGLRPTAIVSDINLKGSASGLELARSIASRWPELRVILVSGELRPERNEYPEEALFLTKPYAPAALVTLCEGIPA